jgi:hypothetical protein
MHVFHETQSRTYIGALVALMGASILINYFGGAGLNVQNWVHENIVVIAMLPVAIAALLWRTRWVQIGAPIVLLGLFATYMVLFYPELR